MVNELYEALLIMPYQNLVCVCALLGRAGLESDKERFHLRDDRFDFADVRLMTANVDPLVISVLRREHVVKTTLVPRQSSRA